MKIAESGIFFEKAFSNSSTTIPSLISLFSSTYPNILGGMSSLKRRETIAEIFRYEEYKTICININTLIEVTSGFKKGFEVFYNLKTNFGTFFFRKIYRTKLTERLDSFIDYHIKYIFNENYLPSVRGEIIASTVKEVLNNYKNRKPIFLWCHFMDTHIPYKPPSWIFDINLKIHSLGYTIA